jgi:hypothetical protein
MTTAGAGTGEDPHYCSGYRDACLEFHRLLTTLQALQGGPALTEVER